MTHDTAASVRRICPLVPHFGERQIESSWITASPYGDNTGDLRLIQIPAKRKRKTREIWVEAGTVGRGSLIAGKTSLILWKPRSDGGNDLRAREIGQNFELGTALSIPGSVVPKGQIFSPKRRDADARVSQPRSTLDGYSPNRSTIQWRRQAQKTGTTGYGSICW